MSQTTIHTTKKLEKQVAKLIRKDEPENSSPLGKWNAHLFYISRKKCWLVTNKKTQYHLLLTDITAKKLKDIDRIFTDVFYEQLVYDGMVVNHRQLSEWVGDLAFRPTDNDRRMNGFQKQRLFELEWKTIDYAHLDDMPIRDFNQKLNQNIIHLDKDKTRSSDYTRATENMQKLINGLR